jgi:hypothetical protein
MQRVQVATGGYTLALEDGIQNANNNVIYLDCLTGGGAIDIALPPISSYEGKTFWKVIINDADNNAGGNSITITPDAGESNLINSAATLVISTNGEGGEFYIVGDTDWKADIQA